MNIRRAVPADGDALVGLWLELWPDAPRTDHESEIRAHFSGPARSTLPIEILVADTGGGTLAGFVEVALRSHADGCDARHPVTYIEGWYVAPDFRRTGVGRALIEAAEDWGRAHGCTEVASDTWLDNEASQAAHLALGFVEVDRCVNYRKSLSSRYHR